MQAYPQAFAQPNKGTLVPGQSITVNKYTVVVERYLSQGGFAHVYLVQTAQPVYNTSHHVLKRIAVPNETMLSEVKKEVDIMRILKGHPNIVFLIDAAWHRMSNGTYEVFILMEFCPGGGIIDMMNRRLRERLTEAEILTIFVDVCEGLAAMHALKPPILHRDLKVENILQASPTSYKLCDFGSATPVQKVPSNTQELRMLEADLNRHTTLQYRAPEMIDVHLRRPIDEKSDVWALGVLLYKLCYYTTPFEEHGPLAILNVQYKIPPYPVYSAQMNSLIASMLREHGTHRPTVFEILQHVHALRGTKSRFTYNIPPREPLSPRSLQAQAPLQVLSPNIASNPLDDLVSYKSQQPHTTSPAKNAGVEAREKVLEAIAPMRRGRPPQTHAPSRGSSRPASPDKPVSFETKFSDDGERAWKGLRPPRSFPGAGSDAASLSSRNDADAWSVDSRQSAQKAAAADERRAFDNDFSTGFGSKFTGSHQLGRMPPASKPAESTGSGFGSGFGDAFDPAKAGSTRPLRTSRIGKDAFDGLGLPAPPPATTLGEARKSRTGLASFGMSSNSNTQTSVTPPKTSGLGTSNTTYRPPSAHPPRPTPSPQPSSQPQPQSSNLSPIPPPSQTWRQHVKAPTSSQDALSAEERFPSLEDLDRTFGSPSPGLSVDRPSQRARDRPSSRNSYMGPVGTGAGSGSGSNYTQGVSTLAPKNRFDGVRSQNVTGTAMRETRPPASRQSTFSRSVEPTKAVDGPSKSQPPLMSRPSLSRKHRSSVTMKSPSLSDSFDLVSGPGAASGSAAPPSLPPRPEQQGTAQRTEPRDWLTGAEDEAGIELGTRATTPSHEPQPVLRDSPSKRASYIERSPIALQKPLEAENIVVPSPAPEMPRSATTELEREWNRGLDRLDHIPAGKTEREKEREREREKERERERIQAAREEAQKKLEKGRSRSPVATKAFITRGDVDTSGLGLQIPPVEPRAHSTTPSPSGLTENWSPVQSPGGSSSSDDGPEDLNGYSFKGGVVRKTRSAQKDSLKGGSNGGASGAGSKEGEKRRRARSKSRQGSVHDLVDLWGGGLDKDKEKPKGSMGPPPPKRSSMIVPSSTMKPPPLTNKPRSSSPQPIATSTSTQASRPLPSPTKHGKQPSSNPSGRRLPIPSPSPTAETPTGRSRPSSMFIAPVSASKSTPGELGSSTEAAASFAHQALSPPDTPRSRRSARRSSISDMVQRYEAIGIGSAKAKGPAPGAPAKPAGIALKTHQPNTASTSTASDMSPSAAATRFPKLSPTASPVMSKASLAVPEDASRPAAGSAARELAKHRASPTGLPPRSSPVGRLEMPYTSAFGSHATGASVNGLPSRRSPLEPAREQQPSRASVRAPAPAERDMPPPPSPRMERRPSAQLEGGGEPGVRSPSPEKPYQGVSKLIDRWQRVVDETAPVGLGAGSSASSGVPRRGGPPARRAGMVSGGAGRG